MSAIPRSGAAQQRGKNKGICSNCTLAHASSSLLISGRRRTSITNTPVTCWCASWRDSFHDTSRSPSTSSPACWLLIGTLRCWFADSPVNIIPAVGTPICIWLVSSSDSWRRARPACSMTAIRPISCCNGRHDFRCRRDVHRHHLHPGALRGAILSATSVRPPPRVWDSTLSFNFEIGLCLVTAWAIPRALWAAPGGAARYNQLWRAINNKPFQCSEGCHSQQRRHTAAQVEQGDLFKFYASSR